MADTIRSRVRRRLHGHDARELANFFIRRSLRDKSPKTPLQILKLIYFAHALMLAAYKRPITLQPIEAWTYGPVVPDVYFAIKGHGREPVDREIENFDVPTLESEEERVLNQTYEQFGNISGMRLSHMTHWPESPWFNARLEGKGAVINDEEIQEYYERHLVDDD